MVDAINILKQIGESTLIPQLKTVTEKAIQYEEAKQMPHIDATVGYAIPESFLNLVTQPPLQTGVEMVSDFWKLALGTPEQKIETVTTYLPVTETGKEIVEQAKEAGIAAAPEFYTTPVTITGQPINITFPDILGGLKDIGKWVGIGLLAVVGIWGATKIFSRKK